MANKYIRHENSLKIFYANLDKIIDNYQQRKRKILMFGSGTPANMAIYYLKIHGIMVDAILDNDFSKQGSIQYGLPVYSPSGYLSEFDDDILILIASSYEYSMIHQLNELGYTSKHICQLIKFEKIMSDFSFVDRTGYRELNRFELRQHQLNVLRHLKKLCDQYGLRYWLVGGTLLGAIRHRGYIPWDDDIDVYVEMKDLKKLTALLQDDPDFGIATFVDQSIDISVPCAYMYEMASDMDINYFPTQISCGISIDIFPLTGIPDTQAELEKYITDAKQLNQNIWKKIYSKQEARKATTEQMKFMSHYDFDKCSHVGYIYSRWGYYKEIFPVEGFINTTQVEFEGEYYRAPLQWENYLVTLYGENYMQLPPESERVPLHRFKAYMKDEEL